MAAARLSEGLGTFLEWTAAQTESHHIKTAATLYDPIFAFQPSGPGSSKGLGEQTTYC